MGRAINNPEKYTTKELKALILLELLRELKESGNVDYIEFTRDYGFNPQKRFYYLETIKKWDLDIEIKSGKGRYPNTVIIAKTLNNFEKVIKELKGKLKHVNLSEAYRREIDMNNEIENKFDIENIINIIIKMDLTACVKDKAIHRLAIKLKPKTKKERQAIDEAYEKWRKCYTKKLKYNIKTKKLAN